MNDLIQTWFPVAQWIATLLVIAIVFWLRATIKDTINSAIDAVKAQFDNKATELERKAFDHQERLVRLETRCESFISSEDLQEISGKVSDLNGSVERMDGRLEGIDREMKNVHNSQARIESFLLETKMVK